MSFSSISLNGTTYKSTLPGQYTPESASFSDPQDRLSLSGGTRVRQELRASVARIKSVNMLPPTSTTVVLATGRVQLLISVPPTGAISAASIKMLIDDITAFATVDNISRLLKGEV